MSIRYKERENVYYRSMLSQKREEREREVHPKVYYDLRIRFLKISSTEQLSYPKMKQQSTISREDTSVLDINIRL